MNVSLEKGTEGSIFYLAKKVFEFFQDKEGEIFICNGREMLALVHTGKGADALALQKNMQARFPEYKCIIDIVAPTNDGLQKIEVRLKQEKSDEAAAAGASPMLKERQNRQKNVIMIAEDDMFMRSLVKKAVDPHGDVTALEDGTAVVDTYLKILPDIVFLDIHLPAKSGIEILNEILAFDRDAHVVMLSSDSAKDNVLNTQKIGAKGFIAKPFTKEKLEETLWKCSTMTGK